MTYGIVFALLAAMGGAGATTVTVDFADGRGPVKSVNGVGQPPILGLDGTNMFHCLREAGIPYSPLHDVGGYFLGNVFILLNGKMLDRNWITTAEITSGGRLEIVLETPKDLSPPDRPVDCVFF